MPIRNRLRQVRDALRDGGVWDALAVVGIGDGLPLKKQDRPVWAAAQSLDDLGELTAQWLEGRIESQPGYYGPVDVDEADAPGLTDALIAANRAGYVTTGSQAGFDDGGYDGEHWVQHAAVIGYARDDTIGQLRPPMQDAGYTIITDARDDTPRGVYVTFRDDQPYTRFGARLSRWVTAHEIYGGVGQSAVDEVCGTPQMTIYDPVPGRNTLWGHLREATDQDLAEAATTPSSQDTDDDIDGV